MTLFIFIKFILINYTMELTTHDNILYIIIILILLISIILKYLCIFKYKCDKKYIGTN